MINSINNTSNLDLFNKADLNIDNKNTKTNLGNKPNLKKQDPQNLENKLTIKQIRNYNYEELIDKIFGINRKNNKNWIGDAINAMKDHLKELVLKIL